MKKISLLMLTLLLSVVSFAQKPATGQKAEVYPGPESLPVYMVPASSGFEKEAYTAPWRTRRAFSGDVITDQPEGTLKTYVRSGSYVNAKGNIKSQTGFADIVFANDGKTVWFKDLASYNLSTWVKGTIDGNTITVPLGQPIANLDPTYGTAVLGITFPTANKSVSGNLTFTMTEKTITLDYYTNYTIGVVGGCFEYGETLYGLQSLGLNYGVYATVFTLFEEPEVVTPPDGLSTTDMPMTASENGSTDYNATVKVGWAGNDVYIQGINKYLPEAWVKGTLNEEGTKVTFPVQYMGKDTKTPYYLTGYSSKGNMPAVTMDYDAETKTFTGNGTIIINGSATAFSYVVFYNGLIIGTPPTPIVVPDGLETKSYAMAGQYTEDGETLVDIAEDYVVKIGVAEGVYYIQGLLPNVPEGWVQGTLADGKLTIPAGQYVGKDTRYGIGQYIVAGTNDAIEDIVLDYDATNDKFTTTSIIYTSSKKKSINWYIAINSGAIIGTRSAVNIADGIENGTVKVSQAQAFTGDVVTVTATPAEGYELDAITVKGADESAIEVSAENTFVMPAQAVTVSATFKDTRTVFDFVASGAAAETLTKVNLNFQVNMGEGKEDRTNRDFRGYKDYAGTILPAECQVALGEEMKVDAQGLIVSQNRYFAVYGLHTGDKVTIIYSGVPEGSQPAYSVGTSVDTNAKIGENALVSPTSAINSGDVIEITKAGSKNYIIMSVFSGMRIEKVYIQKAALYNVTKAESITNGDIKLSATTAAAGDEVTVTATPAEGYELEAITVTGVNSNVAVEVTDGKFTMPADDVTVSATFKKDTHSKSLNIEQLVLDKTTKADIAAILAEKYIEISSNAGLDSLNDEKTLRNEPFLGLKIKAADATVKVLVKKGNALNVKFGCVNDPVNVAINGTPIDTQVAKNTEGSVFTLPAAEADQEVVFTTTAKNTVVLKQIMIGEDIAAVTLPAATKYQVSVAEGIENGTVEFSATSMTDSKGYKTVKVGDEVTITATPAEGYELEAVTVKGVTSNEAIVVTDGKFTMPADAVTINATFKVSTGINGVKADALKDAQIYNLQGVRVDKAQKGLYIVNGRKVVIK